MNSLLAKKWPRTRLKVQSAMMERHLLFFLHGQLRASEAALEACTLHRVFPTTIVPYMINSRRHYCRSNCIAFRELDSFAQDVSEVQKRSLMVNTRWKTAEGLPTKNGSSARMSSTSGDIVAARWRRAWWRRALRARAISKWACQQQFDNNQRFVFWRETFSSTFSSGAKMSRALACADQRLMASPLRQTSHSAGHWRFLPPFFFCGCWCNFFFHRPLVHSHENTMKFQCEENVRKK